MPVVNKARSVRLSSAACEQGARTAEQRQSVLPKVSKGLSLDVCVVKLSSDSEPRALLPVQQQASNIEDLVPVGP